MSEELKDQRVTIMLTPSEFKAVEDWSFNNRIRSRGEAIRRLLMLGLGADREIGNLRFADVLGKEDFLKNMIEIYSEAHPAEDWFDEILD